MSFYRPKWSDFLNFTPVRLIIGSCCSLCMGNGAPGIDLCDACESLLHRCVHTDRGGRRTRICLKCGTELPVSNFSHGAQPTQWQPSSSSADFNARCCHDCRFQNHLFRRIVAPYRYEFPLDHLIQGLKYKKQRHLARVLGSLLARCVASESADDQLPDFLVPVPLHPSRQLSRGFNQAADIARWCARDLALRVLPRGAERLVHTESMAGLSRAARQHRILGAFQASEAVAGKRIAIVDDVLTTGSTARELARELYDTGAESVELWVLARTSSDR